ncbi:Polyketide cyclase / dehydrase and lipid transport [Nocardia otitidiscaviarum]|uniref:Polyketide cyclase / dehydrase and lipid transport n=1 Tax=Nocardia otitidiscaviarum TaxID=1823 RepID=A0A378YU62_9NOCA|nr:SRPBCC family protein [Nocardia otitidiscaviarum]MBF6236973.1 SRPBCC family protein [Nocardia otitidiscaviarum]SUA80057.1 Polyketide cyclase / dehydrase and lipid transport [Nocardia otitidiscaviarum]
MPVTTRLHTQYPAAEPVDDSVFDTAALVFTVDRIIDAPLRAVWTAFDDDRAWSWLPIPRTGVRYDSPARGVGVIREMGSVFDPLRVLWVERERFWRYEPQRRITFGVVSGTWMQYLLVRQYAEDMTFEDLGGDRTAVAWTVAVTPRLPLRFATWFPPLWRLAYRVAGVGPLFERRVHEIAKGVTR